MESFWEGYRGYTGSHDCSSVFVCRFGVWDFVHKRLENGGKLSRVEAESIVGQSGPDDGDADEMILRIVGGLILGDFESHRKTH